jgi:hypothetical protein
LWRCRAAGDPRADGTFRLTHGAEILEATSFGVLQTADQWASVTARVHSRRSGDERSAVAIVEFADPFVDGRPKTVTITVDGQPHLSGVLQ